MDGISYLNIKTHTIVIPDEKGNEAGRITLRQMSASRNTKFFQYLQELSKENFDMQGKTLLEALQAQQKQVVEFVSFLACEDVDPKFIQDYITHDMMMEIIVKQNELNGLDEFLKKMLALQVKEGAKKA